MKARNVITGIICGVLVLASSPSFAAPSRAKLYAMIQDLQATVATLQTQLASIQANPAVQMGDLGYVKIVDTPLNGVAGPNIVFEGVNLHLQDGTGNTLGNSTGPDPSGLGNLIIGYDEEPDNLLPGERNGAHNLIMGREHRFMAWDSILHGWGATVNKNAHASVALASDGNTHNASYSVSLGGQNNVINDWDIIVGGADNVANGERAVIVGGQGNSVTGHYSTVTGGTSNQASGIASSVSGGTNVQAVNDNSWAAGSLSE